MSMAEVLSNVKRINGVAGYILLDSKGKIITRNTDLQTPEQISKMVYSCGRNLFSVGKKYFKYASFSRKNNKDILIFPVGNYYLGVVKQAGIGNYETASAVMEFLNVLAGKRN